MVWDWLAKGAARVQEMSAEYRHHHALIERLLTLDQSAAADELTRAWQEMDDRGRSALTMTLAGMTLRQQAAGSSADARARAARLKAFQGLVDSLEKQPPVSTEALVTEQVAKVTTRLAGAAERTRHGIEEHGPRVGAFLRSKLDEALKTQSKPGLNPPPASAPEAPSSTPALPKAPRTTKRAANRTAKQDVIDLLRHVNAAVVEGRALEDLESEVTTRISQMRAFTDEDVLCISSAPADVLQVASESLVEAGIQDPEALRELGEMHVQARALHHEALGEGSRWQRSRHVVAAMAEALATGADRATALAEANASLVAIEGLSAQVRAETVFGLHSLDRHYMWLRAVEAGNDDPVFGQWNKLRRAIPAKGPTPAWVAKAAEACRRAYRLDDVQQAEGRTTLAMAIAGCALASRQDVLPGLQPLQEVAFDAVKAVQSHQAPPDFETSCRMIIVRFEARASEEGFSEYLFNQAVGEIKELPQADDGSDAPVVQRMLIELIDHALPLGPPEAQGPLRAARNTLSQMEVPDTPLDMESFVAQGEAVVAALRAALSSGADAGGAIAEALGALQVLFLKAPDDQRLLESSMRWTQEIGHLAAQHAPADKQELARQMMGRLDDVLGMVPEAVTLEGADADIMGMQMRAKMADIATIAEATSTEAEAAFIEVVALIRGILPRTGALEDGATGMDAKEAKRLSAKATDAIERARSTTLDTQLVEQLRRFLRPLASEVLRFERRRHLTLIEPPWSTEDVVAEPNAVFTCASQPVKDLVDAAASRIGMAEPSGVAHAEFVQQRWLQLRASAVAVLDFTTYDRARCDPPDIPGDPGQEASLLAAAAATAQSAYEAGWALVLGVPIVIVADAERGLPFDIDVNATRLRGDEGDVNRIAAALNRATLGMQRGASGDGLEHLLACVRARVAAHPGMNSTLDAVTDTRDALRVRYASEFALRAAGATNESLLVLPAFPAVAAHKEPELFHVTAFRPWMAPVEDVLRTACRERGVGYHIGHEDLDPQIVLAVWKGIARAQRVVCDITLLNPNAVLELAAAQAVGRPVLILSRHGDTTRWLPSLAKTRVHSYRVDAGGLTALRKLVDRFMDDGEP